MRHATGLAAGLGVLLGCALVGCAGADDVEVTPPTPSAATARACAELVAAAPSSVAGAGARNASPASDFTAAWGDPAVLLRCGVPRPDAMTRTAQCFVIDGVGWLATQNGVEVDPARFSGGTLVFTTIGRSAYVEVTVPDHYQPAADALVDLSRAIREHTAQQQPCS